MTVTILMVDFAMMDCAIFVEFTIIRDGDYCSGSKEDSDSDNKFHHVNDGVRDSG